ncbi:MAG: Ig domain-containing protein, partial [Bacteroidales bacterium]|nr:Ig domain-containing protein [Bacteroidales bacterium]
MRKTISKVATAIAVAVLSSAIIISCGPEEQPGGNNGGGNDDVPATPSTISVTGVSLNKNSLNMEEGESESLVATIAPSNATNKAVNWTSSAPGVATVDGNGKVTAVKAGSATITVTTSDGSKTSKCEVKVSAKIIEVENIVVTPETAEIFEGETVTLSATISPEDASDKSITWESRSPGIAVVDNKGVVTGVSDGIVNIDAKARKRILSPLRLPLRHSGPCAYDTIFRPSALPTPPKLWYNTRIASLAPRGAARIWRRIWRKER